jgi:hypothetical protein
MASVEHEALVDLFRHRGELAPDLLRLCSAIELAHHHVESDSAELSQTVTTEYRADLVVRLCKADGETTAAVIIEIQRGVDKDKRFTWPLYVTALRARLRCPVFLLVVAPEQSVAAWADASIEIGQPGFVFRPSVVAFAELPRIVNAADAKQQPYFAVLSALAHRERETAMTAISAIRTLSVEERRLYTDLILSKLSDELRTEMGARMDKEDLDYIERTYYAKRYFHEGLAKGECKALQATLLNLARIKLARVTGADELRLKRQKDAEALGALIVALAQAATPGQARAVFDAALPRRARRPVS